MKNIDTNQEFRFLCGRTAVLLALFLIMRFAFLTAHPISNDETLYINYSQLIGGNWDEWKFISMRNANYDWKPPLPFWLASPYVGLFSDPLAGVRLVAASVSAIGFLSVYALGGLLAGQRAALWTGLFWIFNPMTLFYDRLFLAETFVYSFAAAALLFTWLAARRSWLFAVPAVAAGACALLSKQSGQLAVISLLFLALLPGSGSKQGERLKTVAAALIVAAASYALYRLVIPVEYFADFSRFTGQWTFSARELLGLPISNWMANGGMVWKLYTHYYTVLALVLAGCAVLYSVFRRGTAVPALAAMLLFNSAAIIFALRGFNEYMYHTSTAVFLTLLMAFGAVFLFEGCGTGKNVFARLALGAGPFVVIAFWLLHSFYYYAYPAQYISRFGTPWMQVSYLNGWSGGFWIKEALELLGREKVEKLYLDPQPGNPRTAFFVYSDALPLASMEPMGPGFFTGLETVGAQSSAAVFKQRGREWERALFSHPLCARKVSYAIDRDQMPLVVCLGSGSTENTEYQGR